MSAPIIIAWSGGKDSALALHRLRADPHYTPVGLLTAVDATDGRVSVHGVEGSRLDAQAAATGLPLERMPLPAGASNAVYTAAFHAALARIRAAHPAVRHIAFGDLFLEDIRAWREALVRSAPGGWNAVFPLWGEDTTALARAFIDGGFRATLVAVDPAQLDPAFVGRAYDHALLRDLPPTVDPCGERGEFHTMVEN